MPGGLPAMYQIAKRKPASWQQINKYQGRTSKSKGYYSRIAIKYVKALTEKKFNSYSLSRSNVLYTATETSAFLL